MKYEQLSNTLTFERGRKDSANVLMRLINELRNAGPEVPNFQVNGPWRSRFLRRESVKLVFTNKSRADIALKWISENFKIR